MFKMQIFKIQNVEFQRFRLFGLALCSAVIMTLGMPPNANAQTKIDSAVGAAKNAYIYATAYRNEIEASHTKAEFVSANSTSVLGASVVYKYMFAKAMQTGVKFDLTATSGNLGNNTYLGIWGIFAYNFNQSWNNRESWFGEIAAGMVDTALGTGGTTSGKKSEKKFSYSALFGKYIPLWERIKMSPKAGIRKIGDLDAEIVVIPLSFTFGF